MNAKKIKTRLDKLYAAYGPEFLSSDPLFFVHQFKDAQDREIVALIASSLAYGQVPQIKKSIRKALDAMDNSPHDFVTSFNPKRDVKIFSGFKHRFNDAKDISCLIYFAKQMIEQYGSIGGFFEEGYSKKDVNIKNALSSFVRRALALDSSAIYGAKRLPEKAGVRFFFPSPEDGSPCKRLNLMLRWMVRRNDGLDFGLWKFAHTSQLVMPLDTHVARISRLLGLTEKANASWIMAEEVTGNLKKLDPLDPVKYDFAICRLGILDECPKKKDAAKCRSCGIKDVCIIE